MIIENKRKSIILCILLVTLILSLMSGCEIAVEDEPIKIYFYPQNGEDTIIMTKKDINTAILPDEPQKAGYLFDGWFYDNNNFEQAFSFDTLDKEQSRVYVYAKWIDDVSMNLYTVKFLENGGDLIYGETTQQVQHGTAATPPVFEREAYVFTHWDKDINNITGHTNIYAQWEINTELELLAKATDDIFVKTQPVNNDNFDFAIFPENNTATVLEICDNNWYKINFFGQDAYVEAKDIIMLDRQKHDPPPYDYDGDKSQVIEDIIAFGYTLMDTPYLLGAARVLTPDGELNPKFTANSFDCSSFIQYIFYYISGIKLKGDTKKQSVQGIEIEYEDIQRGDLIYMVSQWSLTGGIGHVGIYLGDDMILHTSYGKGGVNIEEYSDRRKKDTRAIIRVV